MTQLLLLGDCDSQSETALPGSNHRNAYFCPPIITGRRHVKMQGRTQLSSIPIGTRIRNLNRLIQMFQMILKATAGLRGRDVSPLKPRDSILNLRDAPDATSAEERCQLFSEIWDNFRSVTAKLLAPSCRLQRIFAALFTISDNDATPARC